MYRTFAIMIINAFAMIIISVINASHSGCVTQGVRRQWG